MGVFLDENGNEKKEKENENQKDELIDKSTDSIKGGFFRDVMRKAIKENQARNISPEDLEKLKKMAGFVGEISLWKILKFFLKIWFIILIFKFVVTLIFSPSIFSYIKSTTQIIEKLSDMQDISM